MICLPTFDGTFASPSLMFTLEGNPNSIAVIGELEKSRCTARCMVFADKPSVENYFRAAGVSPSLALALFDENLGKKSFHPTGRNRLRDVQSPDWTLGAQWMVKVGPKCKPEKCARQINADFDGNFLDRLAAGQFPWGMPRKGEKTPQPFSLPHSIAQTIADLNRGPNLAAAIADTAHAAELPPGSNISWLRVVSGPLKMDSGMLIRMLDALRNFERVCNDLVHSDEIVQKLLLSGVDLPAGSELAKEYLFPKVSGFSVGRPDMHFTGVGVRPFLSEIDEMPGGMPELVHIDHVYGVNQGRWREAFDWLCKDGPLVFLVSHQWSKCYIPETEWLVSHLKSLGYPAQILTTDWIDQVEFRADGVYLHGSKVGTFWRQFPIFETKGRLAQVVTAACQGLVRLIPEFAHFGNKSWFSVFRSHHQFYRNALDGEMFDILDQILPHSYIVGNNSNPFPVSVNGVDILSLHDLKGIDQTLRDQLVLKVCGANNLAARSYGVLMGIGIGQKAWENWIDERFVHNQPFVIQRRLEAGIGRIPVMNTKTGLPELFSCRILARPWSFNGRLVSVHGCAVPSHLYRVHGMVDMAVVPFAI